MNIRKKINYNSMYAEINEAMKANMKMMERYFAIGKAVSARSEKGAAVAAAEYLTAAYPDERGYSPRNLRRMRDFYRTYENYSRLLSMAMKLSWTQNTVILEADLTMEERAWYLRAVRYFEWSKTELMEKIALRAHEEIVLDIGLEVCDNEDTIKYSNPIKDAAKYIFYIVTYGFLRRRCRGKSERGGILWRTMCLPIFTEKRIVFMRC